jgi:hypothetical protein
LNFFRVKSLKKLHDSQVGSIWFNPKIFLDLKKKIFKILLSGKSRRRARILMSLNSIALYPNQGLKLKSFTGWWVCGWVVQLKTLSTPTRVEVELG